MNLALLIAAVILVVIVLLYIAIIADSFFGGYDFVTSRLAINKVGEILKGREGNLYDLGSARGSFLLGLVKKVPNIRLYGLDNNRFRIWLSRVRALFSNKNISFIHKNIFQTDFTEINTAYIYLEPSLLPGLEKKLQAELAPGSMVITNAHGFPSWDLEQTYITNPQSPQTQKLFVYLQK